MFEKVVKNTEELNAVALHLRTEGEMDELKKLAKKWLIPHQDTEDFITGKRYRLAEIKIEDREYSRPQEKLRVEMLALKDKYFADIIAMHVMRKCDEDDFGKSVLLKHKSLQKCMDFIMGKAFEMAEEQAKQKGLERVPQNTGMAVTETQVFQWVEEYYIRDDAEEEAKKTAEVNQKIKEGWERAEGIKRSGTKKSSGKKTSSGKTKKTAKGGETEVKEKTETKKKTPSDGQMTMFDLLQSAS